MQRQVAHDPLFAAVGSHHDVLRLTAVAGHHAVAIHVFYGQASYSQSSQSKSE